jgi:hypothetical protein
MWIKIKIYSKNEIINSESISKICLVGEEIYINFDENAYTWIGTDSEQEAIAIYQGIEMALNGIDFKLYEDGEEIGYIKPLKMNKDERIYNYMMQKEFMSNDK